MEHSWETKSVDRWVPTQENETVGIRVGMWVVTRVVMKVAPKARQPAATKVVKKAVVMAVASVNGMVEQMGGEWVD